MPFPLSCCHLGPYQQPPNMAVMAGKLSVPNTTIKYRLGKNGSHRC